MKRYQSIYNGSIVTITGQTTYNDLITTRKAFLLSNGVMIDSGLFFTKYQLIKE